MNTKKRQRGRPPAAVPRHNAVTVLLSDAELAALDARAADDHRTRSDALRMLIARLLTT